jgi:hypothetical protein
VAEIKPFKAATTRILNIFHGRDLAIVLRLLTLAVRVCLMLCFHPSLNSFRCVIQILSSPEEFEKLAEKETTLSSA